jgi:hypothetical protein
MQWACETCTLVQTPTIDGNDEDGDVCTACGGVTFRSVGPIPVAAPSLAQAQATRTIIRGCARPSVAELEDLG